MKWTSFVDEVNTFLFFFLFACVFRYFHLSKAFDTIIYRILIQKSSRYLLRGQTSGQTENWLDHQAQKGHD